MTLCLHQSFCCSLSSLLLAPSLIPSSKQFCSFCVVVFLSNVTMMFILINLKDTQLMTPDLSAYFFFFSVRQTRVQCSSVNAVCCVLACEDGEDKNSSQSFEEPLWLVGALFTMSSIKEAIVRSVVLTFGRSAVSTVVHCEKNSTKPQLNKLFFNDFYL